jgi:hypothetical protein
MIATLGRPDNPRSNNPCHENNSMTSYDPQIHHRRSIQLKGYDYSQPGAYFVTLVTRQRDCLFGEIVHGMMQLNPIGKIIQSEWQRLPRHFHNIKLDAFMVMPNHLHGAIVIDPVGATRQPKYGIPDNNHPLPDRIINSLDGSPLQILCQKWTIRRYGNGIITNISSAMTLNINKLFNTSKPIL